jgi:hypothetical protein
MRFVEEGRSYPAFFLRPVHRPQLQRQVILRTDSDRLEESQLRM